MTTSQMKTLAIVVLGASTAYLIYRHNKLKKAIQTVAPEKQAAIEAAAKA